MYIFLAVVLVLSGCASSASDDPCSVRFDTASISTMTGEWLRFPIDVKVHESARIEFSDLDVANVPADVRLRLQPTTLETDQMTPDMRLFLDVFIAENVDAESISVLAPYTASFSDDDCTDRNDMLALDLQISAPAPISEAELVDIEKILSAQSDSMYGYTAYLGDIDSQGNLGSVRLINLSTFNGWLLRRKIDFLTPVGELSGGATEKIFIDEHGSIIILGDLGMEDEIPLPYSITLFSDTSVALAIRAENDAVAHIALGGVKDAFTRRVKMWIAMDELGHRLWGCLASGHKITPDLIGELRESVESDATGPSCGQGGSSIFGNRTVSSGGGLSRLDTLSPLGEPDCEDVPRGPVAQPSGGGSDADDRADSEREPSLEANMDVAVSEPLATTDDLLKMLGDVARELEEASIEQEVEAAIEDAIADSPAPAPSAYERIKEEIDEIQRWMEEDGIRPYIDRDGAGVRYNFYPPLGPDGGPNPRFEDPRCQGRRTSAAQGTLFWDKRFCKGDDPLTCLLNGQTAIEHITGGRCHWDTGPDDNPTFTCESNVEEGAALEPGGSPGGPDAGPLDQPCRGDDTRPGCGPSGQIEQDFISLTPLSDIIVGLCAAGCPDRPG